MPQAKQRPVQPATNLTERMPFQPNSMPFEIHTIEWMEHNRRHNHKPHRHSYHEITWVTQGIGTWLVDLEKHEVTGNTICYVAPGQVHQLKADKHTGGYVIAFNTDFLFLTGHQSDAFTQLNVTKLSEETKNEVGEIVQKMIKEFENFFLLRSELLMGLFKIFLIYLARQSNNIGKPVAQTRNTDLVKKFFSIVDKKYSTHKKVTEYAEHLAVTPNYLNEIVKKVSGFPASYHIQQRIVLEAKRHATYSDSSMKEIAYHLGFDDIAHFSKFFKNVSGQSFTDFKKQTSWQLGNA